MADPRLQELAGSVNERLQERTIRHLLYLTRIGNRQARQIVDFLDDEVVPDLLDQIQRRLNRITERGFDPGPETTRRLREMAAGIAEITGRIQSGQQALVEDLRELAKHEAEFTRASMQSAVGVEFALPDMRQITTVVTKRPMDGAQLDEWFRRLDDRTQERINQAIRLGVTEGQTVDQIVRRIRGTRATGFSDGILQTTRREAEAVARSAVIHTSTQAREMTYLANEDMVKGVQIIATLDTSTCPTCMALDGRVFKPGEGRRPVFHPNCRCSTAPVLKSWRSLGIDADEIPEGTRASMNGQVPASMTYNQWLRRQPASVQDEALGPVRGRRFRAGRESVSEFTNDSGRLLTLDELRRRDGKDFA